MIRLPSISRLAAGLAALVLGGCGDRPGSESAAVDLVEAIYPGQFAFHDSYLQKGHYDVALVSKTDPLMRIRFAVDADPAQCRVGSDCETRLRRAHAVATGTAIRIKAINSAFGACGVPLIGIHDMSMAPGFRTVIELDLDPADQQPALDRLTPCIDAYRQALPANADPALQGLGLRILRPAASGPTAPAPLTLDSRIPDDRTADPSYMIMVTPDQTRALAENLRLYVHYVSASGLDDKLSETAKRALADDPQGGHVPNHALNWQLKLDPARLDVIRTYVLACSSHTAGEGPCKTDVAVRIRYDLATDTASEIAVIRNIRDQRGSPDLPAIPGR